MPEIFDSQERLSILRKHGSQALAYSTLQPGLSYFDVPNIGYIAYLQYRRRFYALGDPICSVPQREHLVAEYLRRHPNSCFVQVHHDTATLIHRNHGFRYTAIGIESAIQLKGWNLQGGEKWFLRRARNKASRDHIEITECQASNLDWTTIHEASARWLATRTVKRRELRFLSRPMLPEADSSIRHFLAVREGQLLGFIFFDPIFSDGNIVGYSPSVSRSCEGFNRGLYYALILKAIDQFRGSGVKTLNLGLSPLAKLGTSDCRGNAYVARLLLLCICACGARLYNFAGIEFAKERFCGETQPVFAVHQHIVPLRDLYAVMKLCQVI